MAHKLLILGESGTGKTSSLRNLDPSKTAIINADRKALPLKGWRSKYVWVKNGQKTDMEKSNYVEVSKMMHALLSLKAWEERDDIETIVVDTITHLINADYVKDTIGKDFKAYQKIGKDFYELQDAVLESSKNVIIMGHIKTSYNDMGMLVTEMVTRGNMIKDFVPPSYYTTVLMTDVLDEKEGKRYTFRTQSTGGEPVKSPAVFDGDSYTPALSLHEPNDVALILDKLTKFENE